MGAGLSTTLTKSFKAGADVPRQRIIKFGAGDDLVVVGAAAGDAVFGVSTEIDAVSGEPVDVHIGGVADVVFGGNVTRGAQVMSDANGRAITAAAAAGTNVRVIGVAMVSAVSGDIGPLLIAPATFQG